MASICWLDLYSFLLSPRRKLLLFSEYIPLGALGKSVGQVVTLLAKMMHSPRSR